MARMLGYIIMLIGVIILLLGTSFFKPINDKLPENIKEILSSKTSTIIGIIILIVGVFLVYTGGGRSRTAKEVPIYRGKHIVGYRRMRVL